MQPDDVIGLLEQIFETGFEWDETALADLAGRLQALGGSPVAELGHAFAGVGLRLEAADQAGNVGRWESHEPVVLGSDKPRVRILGVSVKR